MIEKELDGRIAILGNDLLCGGEIWAREGERVTLLWSFPTRNDGLCWTVKFPDGRTTSVAAYEIVIEPKEQGHGGQANGQAFTPALSQVCALEPRAYPISAATG